jgi:hypothetical protein
MGIPAVLLPIKYENTLKSFFDTPPRAIIIPDNMNMGTARIGKLSTPPSILRIISCAFAGNDGLTALGRTASIPSTALMGMAAAMPIAKIRNKIPTDKKTPPSYIASLLY